jgi:hypothetical protein
MALSCAMVISLAKGNVVVRLRSVEHVATQSHDCCHKNIPTDSQQKEDHCDGGACAMQCCRIVLATSTDVPQLTEIAAAPQVVIAWPVVSHSVSTPEAIFHPPRA